MQPSVVETVQVWLLAVLLYPGLLFGVLVALAGEWLHGALRSLFAPRMHRSQARPAHLLQPARDFLKLAGRRSPAPLLTSGSPPASAPLFEGIASAACALAPVLALALLPLPGSPLAGDGFQASDFLVVVTLLALQPVLRALIRLRSGGLEQLRGAQDIGRLFTGLVPALLAVAALVEVSGSQSLRLTYLTAAPETPQQTIVRLLAGAALLVALPWWLAGRHSSGRMHESAGAYAGRLLQTVALAAFWVVLALPLPGQLAWAGLVIIGGSLLAYVALRIIGERWALARRKKDAANLVWASALPVAALAFVVALWSSL
ncbi:MAG TPA: hypothetical protein VEW94_11600 [Chloroflexia bacterium]|nr:hypothetical protein [Chloroflexia bacterium]